MLDAAAEVIAVDGSRIVAAVSYYGDHRDEIDAEVAAEASTPRRGSLAGSAAAHHMSRPVGPLAALDEMFSPYP